MDPSRIACIGVGGQGWFNVRAAARIGRIAALCDIDRVALARAAATYPEARRFDSCDGLFAAVEDFDAVVVSVPDHAHSAIVRRAIMAGKNCYCEKPLTIDAVGLEEIQQALAGSKCVTCLGCQGVYSGRFRYLLEYLRKLDRASLEEVVAWTDRPGEHWRPSAARLSVAAQSEQDIAWRYWAAALPQVKMQAVHPMGWRAYRGLGTGPIGDMGSHLLALPILAFGLGDAKEARVVQVEERMPECFASSLQLEARLLAADLDVRLRWFHGGFAPTFNFFNSVRRAESGLVLTFRDCQIYCPEWNAANAFEVRGGRIARVFDGTNIPDAPDSFESWLAACRAERQTETSFEGFGLSVSRILFELLRADQ